MKEVLKMSINIIDSFDNLDDNRVTYLKYLLENVTKMEKFSEYLFTNKLVELNILELPSQISITVDKEPDQSFQRNKANSTIQFISLKQTLTRLFETTDILKILIDNILELEKPNNNYSNILKSDLWKSKIQNLPKDNTIYSPIAGYYDDLEVMNVLGSNTGFYKIGAVYTKLLCLPPYLDKIDLIFLTLLFLVKDRKQYGFEKKY
jgi:hypothetical protein